jgi:uncharacterized membrane protein YgcG
VLERISWVHHAAVGGTVLGVSALALFGLIGEPEHPERFDAKQVTVWPVGGEAVRIREVVDQDFGTTERRGYQRFVPDDFGRPTDVTASSPDAPDNLDVVPMVGEVRLRIGDPDVTLTGQHRYVLEFTLPQAQLSSGMLALDIIGTDETLETGRFEVIVAGMRLADPVCSVGRAGAVGGCDLVADGDVYRAVVSPLAPGRGITIGGRITEFTTVALPDLPDLPDRRDPHPRRALALGLLPVGLATSAFVYTRRSRRGRNEVFLGGAADAAFGALPAPVPGGTSSDDASGAPVRLVTDRRMGDLATIEFAPPTGLEPWEGAVLLSERISDDTVAAWFSGLAGREAITLNADGATARLGWGPRRHELDRDTERLLATVLRSTRTVKLGTYDKKFAELWSAVRTLQDRRIKASGWWKHQAPQSGDHLGCSVWPVLVFTMMMVFGFGSLLMALIGLLSNIPFAIVFAVVASGLTARVMYRALLPARSATGSALALRTESFRRFLDASEGQHVQWAWERGVLREYTAWAVALGEADAWNKALKSSNLPEASAVATSPMLVHSMRSSLTSTTVAPSSSSGSGSSGFSSSSSSSGSVGGGGGGGRSGSW